MLMCAAAYPAAYVHYGIEEFSETRRGWLVRGFMPPDLLGLRHLKTLGFIVSGSLAGLFFVQLAAPKWRSLAFYLAMAASAAYFALQTWLIVKALNGYVRHLYQFTPP